MAITINDGGVLRQLSKININDGGILKPIYGVPKDNMNLYWGGFTGASTDGMFLIGEFTVDCPLYFNYEYKSNDYIKDIFTTLPTDSEILPLLPSGTDLSKGITITYTYKHLFYLKLDKNMSPNSYVTYEGTHTVNYKRNGSGVWQSLGHNLDIVDGYYRGECNPISLPEGTYYIYVSKYLERSGTGVSKTYLPMDGMSTNYTLNFQTLEG